MDTVALSYHVDNRFSNAASCVERRLERPPAGVGIYGDTVCHLQFKKRAKINIRNAIFLNLILVVEKLKFFLQGSFFNFFPTFIGFFFPVVTRRVYFILCR